MKFKKLGSQDIINNYIPVYVYINVPGKICDKKEDALKLQSSIHSGFYELPRNQAIEAGIKGETKAYYFMIWDMPDKESTIFKLHQDEYLRLDEPLVIKKTELLILDEVKNSGRPLKKEQVKINIIEKVDNLMAENPGMTKTEACSKFGTTPVNYNRYKKSLQ
ncbi:MAG: hypothetical protein GY821_17950 [Gammaproteobacteria bacterium]|nr:hypothetical protein [Gammaproteobacteria bacterium]